MPWREKKDHYSFAEIANRWRLSIQDIGYFAERGQLEVHTWLSDVLVTQYVLRKIEGGDLVPVQTGVTSVTGYCVVDPNELRKIFRAPQAAEVRKFMSLDGGDIFLIPLNNVGCSVGVGALEISLIERDRFETERDLKPRAANSNKTGLTSSSVGRPSVKQLIIDHFSERAAKGETEKTLNAEARSIYAWALGEFGDGRAPTIKTIVNNLRPHFLAHKDADHHP